MPPEKDENETTSNAKFAQIEPIEINFKGAIIRSVMIAGSPWFVVKDACSALKLADTTSAIRGLEDDEKGKVRLFTSSGEQEMNIINESGLYVLAFNSQKSEAVAFRKWVTNEVLPSLRRGAVGERQASQSGSVYVRLDHPGLYRTLYESNGRLSTVEIDDSCLAGEAESAEADAVALAAMLVATLWRNHRLLDQVKAFNEFSNNRFQMDEAIRQANHLAETLIRNRQDRRQFSDSPRR